jgi:hypothetical protein
MLQENISNFLLACEQLGVARNELFRTTDLYDGMRVQHIQPSGMAPLL